MKENQKMIASSFPAALSVFGEYDVVVVGSGMAGCAAAVAAVRNGAKVCLIEREFMAGGLATLGLVWCYLPICDGRGHQVAGGIAEEFLKLSVANGSGEIPVCWKNDDFPDERKKIRYESEFNPLSFAQQLDMVMLESGITIRYGSQVCAVIKEDDTISAVVVAEKQGLGAVICKTVIDATGDCDIACLAGEETVTRSDNRLAYWAYSTSGGEICRVELQSPLYGKLPEQERTFSGVCTEDITDFCVEGRKRAFARCKEKGNRLPVMMPSIPQFRMTRRIVGQYVLQTDDEGRWFDDTVGMVPDWRKRGVVFCAPYRMLLPKKTKNLWVAGRCASAEAEVGETIRSIPACTILGQAAGTAAALAGKHDCDADKVPHMELQTALKADGVILDEALLLHKEQNTDFSERRCCLMRVTKMATITKLKTEMVEEYIRLHDEVWEEVVRLGHEAGLRNFTIYRHGLYLFSTYEYVGDDYEKDMQWKNSHEVIKKWQKATGKCTDYVTDDVKTIFLDEIFHNDF